MGQDAEIGKVMEKIKAGKINVNSREGLAQIRMVSRGSSEEMIARLRKGLQDIGMEDSDVDKFFEHEEEEDPIFNPFAQKRPISASVELNQESEEEPEQEQELEPESEMNSGTDVSPYEYDPVDEISRGPQPVNRPNG